MLLLRYLKDSNAAAHSVDNHIFYVVIYLPERSETYSNQSMARCDSEAHRQ